MVDVMIVGSGAREHALAKLYLKSGWVDSVLVTPGNQGMTRTQGSITIDPSTKLTDRDSFLRVAKQYEPGIIDVAQDDALAAGTVDLLRDNKFKVFGPTQAAARLEWDKEWSREFMKRHGLPIPEYQRFDKNDKSSIDYALNLLKNKCSTVYFKASALDAGKGVVPATDENSVRAAYETMKSKSAAYVFLVEEGMVGEEFSYYAICDGTNFLTFKSAQDNKRVWNRDQGPNTGGMGCNAPALVTKGLEKTIENTIIRPTIKGMAKEGYPYTGILYLGGMVCEDDSVKIVEFNSRWGDPECHVILPGVYDNYFELVKSAIDGGLGARRSIMQDDLTRVCVIGASAGYPNSYEKGKLLTIDDTKFPEGVHWLSAGINVKENKMYTNGGRVFSIVAEGNNAIDARRKALQAMACCSIEGNGLHYRTDIAWRDVEREYKR